jgi:hypothetical protein
MPKPNSLWTAVELAQFLGLSPRTIANLASAQPERLPPAFGQSRACVGRRPLCAAWVETNSRLATPRKSGRPRGSGKFH